MYNFTALTASNNLVGASLSIAVQIAALAVIATSTGRRKRRGLGDPQEYDNTRHLMMQIVSDLDSLDCTAGAVCEAARLPTAARGSEQTWLLDTLNVRGEGVVPYSVLTGPEGKYEYAAFLGAWSGGRAKVCKQAFPQCPISFDNVLRQLASRSVPCEANLLDEDLRKRDLLSETLLSNRTISGKHLSDWTSSSEPLSERNNSEWLPSKENITGEPFNIATLLADGKSPQYEDPHDDTLESGSKPFEPRHSQESDTQTIAASQPDARVWKDVVAEE